MTRQREPTREETFLRDTRAVAEMLFGHRVEVCTAHTADWDAVRLFGAVIVMRAGSAAP